MQKKIIYFLITTIIFVFGCKSIKNDCGRDYINFKILKKEKLNTGTLRFDGVYVWNYDIPNGTPTGRYIFIRFFENGRVYLSCTYDSIPTDEDFNSLNYGGYGHYSVLDNKVIIETYAGYVGYYYTYFALNENNNLVSLGTRARRKKENAPMTPNIYNSIYKFKEVINLSGKSFW